jgi:two-component system response regulator LytT
MRVLVVEDEPVVARRIARLTREILGDRLESISVWSTFSEAEEALGRSPVDVLLLDLDLSGRNGFDLLPRAVAGPCQTIVISANTSRAIEAFEHGVVDYIAKPFNRERLVLAFERVESRSRQDGRAIRVLAVRKRDGVLLVPVADVVFIKAAGPYAELHLENGRMELHSKSLDGLLSSLPKDFTRIHKSYIVRESRIARLIAREGSRYEIELDSGTRLPMGRTRCSALRARLGIEPPRQR